MDPITEYLVLVEQAAQGTAAPDVQACVETVETKPFLREALKKR
jgi:hypothetical protein